jgi:hypothetical protein
MGTDVGGQDVSDGGSIGGRVMGDAFQCIDTAHDDVELTLVVAKLVDRAGESLGDLGVRQTFWQGFAANRDREFDLEQAPRPRA